MKVEGYLFVFSALFFAIMDVIYWLWSHDPTGTTALALTVGLAGLVGFYVLFTGRRVGPRPEDDKEGEIADGAGEQGVFAPWSWWPLVLAAGAALAFAALAVGYWMLVIAVPIGIVGLVGWVFEFSRGQHAH